MKKIFALLLTLVLAVFALTACGEKEADPTPAPVFDPSVVLANEAKTYHIVGGYAGDWKPLEGNKMTAASVNDVKAIDATLGAALEANSDKLAYIYVATGYELNRGLSWNTTANGVSYDGGYTIKVIRGVWDSEDETFGIDQWLPDPHTAHVESLTENLFMPKWVETAAAGEEALGTWADNPVVTSGAGKYTIVFVEYKAISTAEVAGYGLAVFKTEAVDENKSEAEKAEAKVLEIKAAALAENPNAKFADAAKTDPTFTLKGEVVALEEKYSEKYGTYNTNVIVNCGGIVFGIKNLQVRQADGTYNYPKEQMTFKVGDTITFEGQPQWSSYTIGDATADQNSMYKAKLINDWYGVIGSFNEWGGDVEIANKGGIKMTFTEAGEIKVRKNGDWAESWGTAEGGNIAVEAGTYWVALDLDAEGAKVTVSKFINVTVDLSADANKPADPCDVYVWFWGGDATGWFEKVTDGAFIVPANTTGCCFLFASEGAQPAWETKLAQTGDYVISGGVATAKTE